MKQGRWQWLCVSLVHLVLQSPRSNNTRRRHEPESLRRSDPARNATHTLATRLLQAVPIREVSRATPGYRQFRKRAWVATIRRGRGETAMAAPDKVVRPAGEEP